jgi:hypothetical protein
MRFRRETIEFAKKAICQVLDVYVERYTQRKKGVKFGELMSHFEKPNSNLLSVALDELWREGKVYSIWDPELKETQYIPERYLPLKYRIKYLLERKIGRKIEKFVYQEKKIKREVCFEMTFPEDFVSSFLAKDTFDRNEFDIINYKPWELVEASKETRDGFARITIGVLNARIPNSLFNYDKIWMKVEFRRNPGEKFRIPPEKILEYGENTLGDILPRWHKRTKMLDDAAKFIVQESEGNVKIIQATLNELQKYPVMRRDFLLPSDHPYRELPEEKRRRLLRMVKRVHEFWNQKTEIPAASLFRKTKYAQKNRQKLDSEISFLEKKLEKYLKERESLEALLYKDSARKLPALAGR